VLMKGYRVSDEIELYPGGAAHLTKENVIVVADLHLGCEAALEYQGLSLPRVQTRKIEQYIKEIVSLKRPRKIIVAGDLKHNFSRNLIQEWNDVSRFIEMLHGLAPIEVVKGNHDNFLGLILRDYGVPLHREIICEGIRVVHGHIGSLTGNMTVMGHIHPSVRLRDSAGVAMKDQCFLFDAVRRVLVLPALSIVSPGTDVVGQKSSDDISPLLSDTGLSSFTPIMFSGEKALRFPTVGELRRLHRSG
jgi:putative SbcD/Mre11-related phosphoesterase